MKQILQEEALSEARYPTARVRALSAEESVSFSGVEAAIQTIASEESRRTRLVWFPSALCLLAAYFIASVAHSRTNTADSDSLTWLLPLGAALALVVPIFVALAASYPRHRLRDAMQDLARLSTSRELNDLFRANRSLAAPRTIKEIKKALTRALLQVKASDRSQVSEATWAEIHRTLGDAAETRLRLRSKEQAAFYEALIRAMEQIGDERALRALERIAKMRGKSEGRTRIRQAAEECLPALRERIREEKAPDTLLRAAESESDSSLLIPSVGIRDSESQTLLRAGE